MVIVCPHPPDLTHGTRGSRRASVGVGASAVNTDLMANRVYVIELEAAAGRRRDPRLPWVYVGSSARSPEQRFEQHLSGYKASRLPKRFGLRLRPDLYEDLEPIKSKKAAVAAEQERARELAGCGFVAHSDGTSFGRAERKRGRGRGSDWGSAEDGDWTEWDRERLEPVIAHLDAAIIELTQSAFAPLDPERCAHLLYGTHAFWIADYLDQSDPPPSYGLFPHVRLEVLEARASEALLAVQ
jgi:hypothetical protein